MRVVWRKNKINCMIKCWAKESCKTRKLQNKTFSQKNNSLKDMGKGLSNKEVSAIYGVPSNTLSVWVKNKQMLR